MATCIAQYIICFVNVVVTGAYSTWQLCCRSREHQLETKFKLLIVMPFVTTMITASVAFYYLVERGHAECIYFGSWISMLSTDFENQIIIVIGVFFINTMQVVLTRIDSITKGRERAETEAEIATIKCNMIKFVVAFLVFETVLCAIKAEIYLSGKDWPSITLWQILFLALHTLRIIFPVTL